MQDNPLISVIIPVYNVEDYLDRCIQSVINQDYKNLEIFLVDDGSTDSSGSICDKYASEDSRIVVMHQKNAGQSVARNSALKIANGKYYTFIDSDDFIDSDYVSYLLNLLVNNNCELALCSVRHIGFPQQKDIDRDDISPYCCKGLDITKNILLGSNGFSASASHMLVDSNFCKDTKFLEGVIYEDLEFMVKVSFLINKAVASKCRKYNYCYRPNNSSSTHTAIRKQNLDYVISRIRELLQDKPQELISYLDNRYISNSLYLLTSIHKGEKEIIPSLRNDIIKYEAIKSMQSKSSFFMYNALKKSYVNFLFAKNFYNAFRKVRFAIKSIFN